MIIRKIFLKKIFEIMFGIFSSILFFEISLKIIENSPLWRILPVIEPILGEPDKKLGFKYTPKAKGIWLKENRTKVEINSLGIRDFESSKIPNSRFKIILTGDSIVEALQVDQENNFENITEKNLLKENFDLKIFNLAKSGDGPLRQLITLEEIGYPLKPDLGILFSGLDEFFSGELINDSIAPAYKLTSNKEYIRSFSFRNRWQIKYSDSKFFKFLINKLQNYSVIRIFYYRSKEDIKTLILKPRKKEIKSLSTDDLCFKEKIDAYLSLTKGNLSSQPNKLMRTFLNDLENSSISNKVPILYIVNSIPIPDNNCKESIDKRKQLVKRLNNIFKKNNITFIDFNNEIYKLNNMKLLDDKYIKFYKGHLNYNGHYIYSKVFTRILKDYITKNNLQKLVS